MKTIYPDHTGLWKNELADWVPATVFDAHVHLGPADAMGALTEERRREPLSTFTSFSWEAASDAYHQLYAGKHLAGFFAFGFPLKEVNLKMANRYLARLMKSRPFLKGFLLAHPTDISETETAYEEALADGVRFAGVKPYFDFLGKSNYETTIPEFIPDGLLRFMNREKLILMLHTSGVGMSDPENQKFILSLTDRYPDVPVILAHLGRFLDPGQFRGLLESSVLERPSVYLEMSSVTDVTVYRSVLVREELHDRLLFGSDLPFGLITGTEFWSEETGSTFLTRDAYSWSNPELNRRFEHITEKLTYNTYHVIKAFKDAVAQLSFRAEETDRLKTKVFYANAHQLCERSLS